MVRISGTRLTPLLRELLTTRLRSAPSPSRRGFSLRPLLINPGQTRNTGRDNRDTEPDSREMVPALAKRDLTAARWSLTIANRDLTIANRDLTTAKWDLTIAILSLTAAKWFRHSRNGV